MTEQANEIQWYIARDGKQHGPLTDIEMRTFVAHNYLRQSDLIWRPGLPEWQSAMAVFPSTFQSDVHQPVPAPRPPNPAPSAAHAAQASHPEAAQAGAKRTDFDSASTAPRPERNIVKRLALASLAITLIGGGAFALATYHQPLMDMVSGSSPATDDVPPVVSAPEEDTKVSEPAPMPPAAMPPESPTPSETASAGSGDVIPPAPSIPASEPTIASSDTASSASGDVAAAAPSAPAPEPTMTSSVSSSPSDTPVPSNKTQVAAIDTQAALPPPPTVDGSPIDTRLQKIPVWALIKREYPDWYKSQLSAANKLVAENKSSNEVAMLLAQGLVALRRQNAEKALAASSEKLQAVAVAFLEHLKSLRAQSVSACFGFISKGETSPAVVQMMENPENATALNAQAGAIFEAISEGSRNPVKHDPAVKSDYDILIKELGKLGWKDEDLQVFSNPKLLAKREPEQVCRMVQEWFVAHLAVPDKAVRDRLLFETLKPVVSG
jgi:hypothetical protein